MLCGDRRGFGTATALALGAGRGHAAVSSCMCPSGTPAWSRIRAVAAVQQRPTSDRRPASTSPGVSIHVRRGTTRDARSGLTARQIWLVQLLAAPGPSIAFGTRSAFAGRRAIRQVGELRGHQGTALPRPRGRPSVAVGASTCSRTRAGGSAAPSQPEGGQLGHQYPCHRRAASRAGRDPRARERARARRRARRQPRAVDRAARAARAADRPTHARRATSSSPAITASRRAASSACPTRPSWSATRRARAPTARRRTSRASSSRRWRRPRPSRRCSTRATRSTAPRRRSAGVASSSTARAKILKLPEVGQQLVGSGEIPVSAIDTLLAIADVSPAARRRRSSQTSPTGTVAGSQLVSNAGWAIGQALRDAGKDTFGAYLNTVHPDDLKSLRLGKKTDALVAEAEKLHKQVDQYAYGPPTIRFTDADVDQARAAGVLIEFDRGAPIITDRALYRELAKQAIARTVEELRERAAAKAQGKRTGAAKRERTPREELDVEHRATLRELTQPGARHEPRPRRGAAHRAGHGRARRHRRRAVLRLRPARPGDQQLPRHQRPRRADDRRQRAAARARRAPRDDDADAQERQAGQDEGRLRRRRRRREVDVALRRRGEDRRRAVRPRARRVRRPALRVPARARPPASAAARCCRARTRTSRARRSSV